MSALPSPFTSATRGRSYVDTAKKPCHDAGARNLSPSDSATYTFPCLRAKHTRSSLPSPFDVAREDHVRRVGPRQSDHTVSGDIPVPVERAT